MQVLGQQGSTYEQLVPQVILNDDRPAHHQIDLETGLKNLWYLVGIR